MELPYKTPYQEQVQTKVLEGLSKSPTLNKYKDVMRQCISLYYPRMPQTDIDAAIDYSIKKRFQDTKEVRITNSYKRYRDENDNYKDLEQQITLQKLADYILSREPIVTAHGTMFKHHGTEPNPLNDVIQSFLALRSEHKKMMFKFPKGSEDYEKYNLLQSLTKMSRDLHMVTYDEKPL